MTVTHLPVRAVPASTFSAVAPRADRWQPSRAGILNVWRYYEEVFSFHNGRLLLRGPNGTGKSKALELLLPFLFDASLLPSRLSTFGGNERTMHWNLMGDGYPNTGRVGYVWLEFVRLDPRGGPQWFTCGARLAATVHSNRVTPTFFTTSLRVAEPGGLSLVTGDKVPLTRAELAAVLEGAGTIYDSPAGYRRAVREALFRGLSEDQYNALIGALLKLRTPKLSEHLDPEQLSRVLSDSLPPLDQRDLAEIAEGFEKLDRQREDLARLDEEVAAAGRLAERQRRYTRRALRRAAAELISATTVLDNLTRSARASRAEHDRAVADRDALRDRLDEIDRDMAEAEHRIAGLEDTDAYRHGQRLDRLRVQADSARRTADEARGTADQRAAEADDDEGRVAAARMAATSAKATAERSLAEVRRFAVQAGVGLLFERVESTELERAGGELRGIAAGREQQIEEVRTALAAHERAVADRDGAEQRLANRAGELDDAATTQAERAAQRDAGLEELRVALAGWAAASAALPLASRATEFAELAADETAVLDVIGEVATAVREALARDEERLSVDRAGRVAERATIAAERDRLCGAVVLEPAPPPHRTVDRSVAAGAPLWRLVDWRPDTPDRLRAAVEAALQAAGLLDAWLAPDGAVSLTGAATGHDTYLAAALAHPARGGSLADLLVPVADGVVPEGLVRSVLAGVAFAPSAPDHVAAIGADGTWRLGPAHGSWAKPDAEHVGAVSRERAKQRRLAELDAAILALDGQVARLDTGLAGVAAQRATVAAELDRRPSHAGLRLLDDQLARATARQAELRNLVAEAEGECAAADALARRMLRALTLVASNHALPTTRDGLDQLAVLVRGLRDAGGGWLADRERCRTAEQRASELAGQAARTRRIADESTRLAADAKRSAIGLAAQLAAVEEAVDASYRQVLDEVTRLRQLRTELTGEVRRLGPPRDEMNVRIGELGKQLEVDEAERARATGDRDAATARLIRLRELGFARDARIAVDLDPVATTTAALDAARQLATELDRTPYEPRHLRESEAKLSETMHAVSQHLAGHVDLAMEPDSKCDVQVVAAMLDGQRVGPAELVERLDAERDQARAQLTEEERGLFDRTLTGDTRRHVADRIRQADALVREVSAQLERVRTVSALRVRLVWQVDPDLGPLLREARDLLLRDPATLLESEREALHEFFRARIDDVRAAGTAGGWEQQLDEVLDYRRWHRFLVQMRVSGGDWVTVTRRQHGAKSGGEKAIVLHLPLFAAAAAHYRAAPEAARLILLDEVFVGVDSTNRSQLMEVLAAFDLDLMLTSDTEWCTYAELDGIAIHQLLAGGDGDEAVTTARFVWDGQLLHSADDDDQPDMPGWDAGPGRSEPVDFDDR